VPDAANVPAAIVLLAGGRASRLPGKLFLAIDGEPMLARIARRLAGPGRALVVLTSAALARDVRGAVSPASPHAIYLIDREPDRGPLPPIVDAARYLREREIPWFVALAGDMPDVGADVPATLERARDRLPDDACEAVVAVDTGGRRHPLAGLYRTSAVVACGAALVAGGERRLGALPEALRCASVRIGDAALRNVNSSADLAARSAS